MHKPIALGDWSRILRGEHPWSFVLEAILRLSVLYLILLLALRLMGRRMSSQLSRNELLALVSLAAAIGPPMQSPEQGLLAPLVIAALVVGIQRLIAFATFRSHRFENLMDGLVSTLVSDGRIEIERLRGEAVSLESIHSQLRLKGILNLGQVEYAYFEPGGAFSTVQRSQEQPGLSLVPRWDPELRARQKIVPGAWACSHCGLVVASQAHTRCPACNACGEWSAAVCGRQEATPAA